MEEETMEFPSPSNEETIINGDEEPIPDLPQNLRSPFATDSDFDSDSDEEESEQMLQTLQKQLSTNPSNYDAHLQYINILRKLGDIENLKKARESMSHLFPLTPSMWLEWLKDEASISTGPEALPAIESLYERAVFDYLSVSLWCDYLSFVRQYDPSVRDFTNSGIAKARELFERALTAAGLHFSEGEKLWQAYREFEKAIYNTIDKADTLAKEKQIQLIRSIFHRQLSVPLANMESTLQAYKAWEMEVEQGGTPDVKSNDADRVSSQVASAYKKALDMYTARVQFEEQFSRLDITETEKLRQYIVYLKFEQSAGVPARVQVLFERAIADIPVSVDIWLDYARYMDKTLKVGNFVRNVYARATKNCPWIGDLWVRYLLALERAHASEGEIASVFEKSVQCSFSTFDEYLDLFLTRVDGLRRRISSKTEEILEYSLIKETFQRASNYLSPHLKNSEGLLHLYAYWARLELNLGKDIVAARGVWESLLKICGSLLEAWKGYIAMEIELNHINDARSIYKRCYSKRFSGSGSEVICFAWLRFEREYGSLEDFDHAARKVKPRLEELEAYKLQNKESDIPIKQSAPGKRKSMADAYNIESPAKRLKDAVHELKQVKGKGKAQLQNLDDQTILGDRKASVNKPDDTNDQQTKDNTQEKGKAYNDQCTAFISNLNLKATYDHLRDFFQDVGGVVAIRILHDKFTGKSRGLAYVDFSDDEHLTAAVAKNRHLLLGKRLSIARSDPKKGGRTTDRAGAGKRSESKNYGKEPSEPKELQPIERKHKGDNVELKGKNTFAVPRNVRALGWSADKPKNEEEGDERLQTNDEFRKLFFKG